MKREQNVKKNKKEKKKEKKLKHFFTRFRQQQNTLTKDRKRGKNGRVNRRGHVEVESGASKIMTTKTKMHANERQKQRQRE